MPRFDMDDLYIEYQDLVDDGEINPDEISADEWVGDKLADMADRAYDDWKDEKMLNILNRK